MEKSKHEKRVQHEICVTRKQCHMNKVYIYIYIYRERERERE